MIKKIGSILQSMGATKEQVKQAYNSGSENKGTMIIAPVRIGDYVYFLLEDDFPVHKWFYSEEKVTEVCSRGFFTSAFYPAKDDFGNYTRYDEIGTEVFLSEDAAIRAVKERMKQ